MYRDYNDISYAESPFGTLSQYMTKTFAWMFAGLLVTFAVGIGTVVSGLVWLFASTGLIFVTAIAELAMVFVLSARVTKIQPGTATGLFFGYAILNGINLSTIFLVYQVSSLVLAFLVGAVYFGVMAGLRCHHPARSHRLGPETVCRPHRHDGLLSGGQHLQPVRHEFCPGRPGALRHRPSDLHGPHRL